MGQRTGTARKRRGGARAWVAPLLAAFLGGSLLTVLAIWRFGPPSGPPSATLPPVPATSAPTSVTEDAAPDVVSRAEALEAFLLPLAEWRRRDVAPPMAWSGTLPRGESLVQWNARLAAGLEPIGLQVLEGREEIIPRPKSLPLQRLTLVIGEAAGGVAATLVVELARPASLPPAF